MPFCICHYNEVVCLKDFGHFGSSFYKFNLTYQCLLPYKDINDQTVRKYKKYEKEETKMLGLFYKFDVICQDQRECMKDQKVQSTKRSINEY